MCRLRESLKNTRGSKALKSNRIDAQRLSGRCIKIRIAGLCPNRQVELSHSHSCSPDCAIPTLASLKIGACSSLHDNKNVSTSDRIYEPPTVFCNGLTTQRYHKRRVLNTENLVNNSSPSTTPMKGDGAGSLTNSKRRNSRELSQNHATKKHSGNVRAPENQQINSAGGGKHRNLRVRRQRLASGTVDNIKVFLGLRKLCENCFNGVSMERRRMGFSQSKKLEPENIQVVGRFLQVLRLEHCVRNLEETIGLILKHQATLGHMAILESPDYSVGVFILPPGKCIPLHNHPNMCVVTKILHGSARIIAYDKASPEEVESVRTDMTNSFPTVPGKSLELVVPITDKVVGKGTVRALFPETGGNIHLIQADPQWGCVMIDIQAPPYGEEDEERCTYYSQLSGNFEHPRLSSRRAVLDSGYIPPSFSVHQLKHEDFSALETCF